MSSVRQNRLNAEARDYGVWDKGGTFLLDYDAGRYWQDRHEREGFSMRAVADRGKSVLENKDEYRAGEHVISRVMTEHAVKATAQIGDFGCGIGYHLRWLHSTGAKHLAGIDITDTHFANIRKTIPNACLLRSDLTTQWPPIPALDVVICLDVTQHIMTEKKFRHFLQQNVVRALVEGGLFICTTLDDNVKRSYYERGWRVSAFERELGKGAVLASKPRPYRDKSLFAFRVY